MNSVIECSNIVLVFISRALLGKNRKRTPAPKAILAVTTGIGSGITTGSKSTEQGQMARKVLLMINLTKDGDYEY